jgi:acyl dehydratase
MTAQQEQQRLEVGELITDELIEAARARIGVPAIVQNWDRPWVEVASRDTMRHWAYGIGDDNPLFTDPEYAGKTRWGGLIAPPTYMYNMGSNEEVPEIPPEVRARGRGGAMAGIHGFYSGNDIEFYRPVREGDTLVRIGFPVVGIEVKENSAFSGRSVIQSRVRGIFWNQHNELVAIWRDWTTRTQRAVAASKQRKYMDIEQTHYTPEMLQQIEEEIENEEVRGAAPRYWEEVEVGQEMAPMVKGPILLTDLLCFLQGSVAAYARAHKLRHQSYKRHPRAFSLNEFGVPDVVERVHWEDAWARSIGNPYAYDYGWQRNAWVCNYLTNWMGDDAWLWREYDQIRRFVYIGDVIRFTGRVVDKCTSPELGCLVDLEMDLTNQRGDIVAPARATVILPSKEHGPVQLPRAPKELEGARVGEKLARAQEYLSRTGYAAHR